MNDRIAYAMNCGDVDRIRSNCILPPYSPEFMAMEGVWKTTRKFTTHNTFFVTPDQRDAKLTATFNTFQRRQR